MHTPDDEWWDFSDDEWIEIPTTPTATNEQINSEETAEYQRGNSGKSAKKPRGRPFRKGSSGNPAGRPKGAVGIRRLARRHTAAALIALSEIAAHGTTPTARIAAAIALLDRGWGKF